MSNKKVTLNTPVVESREQRLGTIIEWDGKASDFSKGFFHIGKRDWSFFT